MNRRAAVPIVLLVLCACLSAQQRSSQAQPDPEVSAEVNATVNAVDASVHPEIDGQPHGPTPEEVSRERAAIPGTSKRSPATTVWGFNAQTSTIIDDKSGLPRAQMSSFRPEIESERLRATMSTSAASHASQSGANSGAVQSRPWLLNSLQYHPLSIGAKPHLIPRTTVPAVTESDQMPALADPFSRKALVFSASNPFPERDLFKCKDQTTGKRNQHRARKPVTGTAAKSPFDPLAKKRH
jgi:hypothetical protein